MTGEHGAESELKVKPISRWMDTLTRQPYAACLIMMLVAYGLGVAKDESDGIEVQNRRLVEMSGVAPSQRTDEYLWVHNDSGDQPQIYAVDRQGRDVGTVEVSGATAIDWEDMASFKWNDEPWLIVADTGDNQARRSEVTLYAFPEPDPRRQKQVKVAKRWVVRYAEGPHDCEAVAVDTSSQEILLLTKSLLPQSHLYAIPLGSRDLHSAEPLVVRRQAMAPIPSVTAVDLDNVRGELLFCTYANGFIYGRQKQADGRWESWSDALNRSPRVVNLPKRRQGEGICFSRDGKQIIASTESNPGRFWIFPYPEVSAAEAAGKPDAK